MRQYRYSIIDNPTFNEGDNVLVDLGCMFTGGKVEPGVIVGVSLSSIVSMWLVQFPEHLREKFTDYPYSVVSVQHTFIIDESKSKRSIDLRVTDHIAEDMIPKREKIDIQELIEESE